MVKALGDRRKGSLSAGATEAKQFWASSKHFWVAMHGTGIRISRDRPGAWNRCFGAGKFKPNCFKRTNGPVCTYWGGGSSTE